jgi:tetratricopeptide (TPR) repeat protein
MKKTTAWTQIKPATQWYEEGNMFYDQGNNAEAIRCYDQVLTIDSKHIGAWSNKGDMLNKQNKYAEAIRCYDKALAIDPKLVSAWVNKGVALEKQENYAEAIRCYDKVLAIDSKCIDVWTNKGNALKDQGNNAEAIRCYDQVLAIDPKDKNAWFKKGVVLQKAGNNAEAIRCYEKVLTIDSKDIDAWTNKGDALKEQGNNAEAIRCYDQVLAIDPKDKSAWFRKGSVLEELGNNAEAIRCYDKVLTIDSKDIGAWTNKGNALKDQGNNAEAIRCYDQVLAIDPKDKEAWFNKGLVLKAQDSYAEAIRCFEQTLAIDPQDMQAWGNKGDVLYDQGKNAEAIRCYDHLTAIGEYTMLALDKKGVVLQAQGNNAEAIRCFDQALAIDSTFENVWYHKGIALFCQITSADVLSCFEKALSINPTDVYSLQGKAIFYTRQGKSAEAKALFEQVVQLMEKKENKKEAVDMFCDRGDMFFAMKNFEVAKAAFEQALQIKPNLVRIKQRLDRVSKAMQSISVAAAIPPASTSTSSASTSAFNSSAQIKFLNDYVIACFKVSPGSSFYHLISREAAETLLNTCNPGAFLFRSSSQANTIALSYKEEQEISHTTFELLSDGTIRDKGKISTMTNYFLPYGNLLTQPIAVGASLNPSLQRTSSHYKTAPAMPSSTSRSSSSAFASTSQPSAAGLALQDYHQAIRQIAEQERQVFLGLLQTDYQKLLAEYQRLGQQGFESNFQSQQQRFAQYLTNQQQKLQGQGTQQQEQFVSALQAALVPYQGQALASLPDSALQAIQEQLRTTLGNEFAGSVQNLLNSQGYQNEIQRLQQGILQRIQERQDQLGMEMIYVQQKQQQIKNEHDPLFKQYQTQQQKLAEQSELQKQESVRAFYNTIEKVLGSRLMSAMSLASGMLVRVTTKSETAVAMGANLAGKIVDLVPVIGPVANAVIGAGLSIAQTVHGKYVDKKQETKFKNTLDSMIRLEDALTLAELVARRLAQSYQKHIAENYLSAEETAAAGENAANIVYGCIKSGGLKALATKSLDEKVTYLVSVVNTEAQKQKGAFFRKGGVFKEPASAQISTATRKQVHALGADLSKVQEQNELVAKQAQIKLQQMEKEQAELREQMRQLLKAQSAPQFLPPPSPQFLSVPASPSDRPPSPRRSPSPTFFVPPAKASAVAPVAAAPTTFSLLSEDTWSMAIAQLSQEVPEISKEEIVIQRSQKAVTFSCKTQTAQSTTMLRKFGKAVQQLFAGEVTDWEIEGNKLLITASATELAKGLEKFLTQNFCARLSVSAQFYAK